jgi:periplasmic divalent cation tolerance protein
MTEPRCCHVVTTIDSASAASTLAESAVQERLAACAQVSGPVSSTYWWRDAVETAQEWQVVFKTTTDRYDRLADHIRRHHPYEVPEILCLPVIAGNPPYLDWIAREATDR